MAMRYYLSLFALLALLLGSTACSTCQFNSAMAADDIRFMIPSPGGSTLVVYSVPPASEGKSHTQIRLFSRSGEEVWARSEPILDMDKNTPIIQDEQYLAIPDFSKRGAVALALLARDSGKLLWTQDIEISLSGREARRRLKVLLGSKVVLVAEPDVTTALDATDGGVLWRHDRRHRDGTPPDTSMFAGFPLGIIGDDYFWSQRYAFDTEASETAIELVDIRTGKPLDTLQGQRLGGFDGLYAWSYADKEADATCFHLAVSDQKIVASHIDLPADYDPRGPDPPNPHPSSTWGVFEDTWVWPAAKRDDANEKAAGMLLFIDRQTGKLIKKREPADFGWLESLILRESMPVIGVLDQGLPGLYRIYKDRLIYATHESPTKINIFDLRTHETLQTIEADIIPSGVMLSEDWIDLEGLVRDQTPSRILLKGLLDPQKHPWIDTHKLVFYPDSPELVWVYDGLTKAFVFDLNTKGKLYSIGLN